MLLAFDWHSEGVDRLPVSAHLEVKPGTMGEAGRANAANDRQRFYAIALMHDQGVEVRVERLPSPTVIEDNGVAKFLHDPRRNHSSAIGSDDRCTPRRRPADPSVHPQFAEHRVAAHSKAGDEVDFIADKWLSCFELRHFAFPSRVAHADAGCPDNSKEATSETAVHLNIACPTDAISSPKAGPRKRTRATCPAKGRRSASCCKCRCGAA